MEKIISYSKMSKKQRRAENLKRRNGWGTLNPITRKPPVPNAYDRNKMKRAARREMEA